MKRKINGYLAGELRKSDEILAVIKSLYEHNSAFVRVAGNVIICLCVRMG